MLVNPHAINVEPTCMDSNHIPLNSPRLLPAGTADKCLCRVDLFVHASAFHHRGGTVSPLHPFAALQHRSIVFSTKCKSTL